MTLETGRRRGWTGGQLALLIIAILLASVFLAIVALTIGIGVIRAQTAQDRIGTTVKAEQLLEGDCVAQFARVGGTFTEYELVDCDEEHAAELVYIAQFGNDFDSYLGTDASAELASSICETTLRYHLKLEEIPAEFSDAFLFGVYQSRANWEQGKTQFQCFLVNRDGRPLVGQFYRHDVVG